MSVGGGKSESETKASSSSFIDPSQLAFLQQMWGNASGQVGGGMGQGMGQGMGRGMGQGMGQGMGRGMGQGFQQQMPQDPNMAQYGPQAGFGMGPDQFGQPPTGYNGPMGGAPTGYGGPTGYPPMVPDPREVLVYHLQMMRMQRDYLQQQLEWLSGEIERLQSELGE